MKIFAITFTDFINLDSNSLLVTTVAFNSVALISVRERPKMMKKSLNI
jgi:hypothetical protein